MIKLVDVDSIFQVNMVDARVGLQRLLMSILKVKLV